MTHDPLRPLDHDPLCCGETCWEGCPCNCDVIAKVRADERERAVQRTTLAFALIAGMEATRTAIAETLAYLADEGTGTWDAQTLSEWAKDVANQPITYSCCPFCSEVECDGNCPMRHVR